MYQSTYSRGSYDPSQFQTFVSQFLEWMKRYVELPVTGDAFQILSDLKLTCELIIRVCPLQALIDVSQLDIQGCDIESTYHYLCDRLNIPAQFRFNRNMFVYRDAQMLQSCLQALISTFILYNSPEKLELPDVLIERCTRHSSRLSQSDRSSYISNSKPQQTYNTPPPNGYYYRSISGNGFYQPTFHDNRSYNSSSIPTLSVAASLDSDGANSASASPHVYNASPVVPDETPLFTPVQSQIQVNRQELFLEELEQEKKKEQSQADKDRSGSKQLQSPRHSTNHLSLNSNESCSESDNDIAEETIIPRDKHVEKQQKKKKFWKTIAAIGATVGVVAGTVLAVAAASSKGDRDSESE